MNLERALERIADVEEENRQLRAQLGADEEDKRLTGLRNLLGGGEPRALRVLLALYCRRRPLASRDYDLLFGRVVDENVLKVHVWKLRRLCGPGIVETVWGNGYRLSPAGRLWLESSLAKAA